MAGAKEVIYTKSYTDYKALAKELKYLFYYAKDIQQSEKLEQQLLTGGFIIATSTLSTRVNYPSIVFVLQMDILYMISLHKSLVRQDSGEKTWTW